MISKKKQRRAVSSLGLYNKKKLSINSVSNKDLGVSFHNLIYILVDLKTDVFIAFSSK